MATGDPHYSAPPSVSQDAPSTSKMLANSVTVPNEGDPHHLTKEPDNESTWTTNSSELVSRNKIDALIARANNWEFARRHPEEHRAIVKQLEEIKAKLRKDLEQLKARVERKEQWLMRADKRRREKAERRMEEARAEGHPVSRKIPSCHNYKMMKGERGDNAE